MKLRVRIGRRQAVGEVYGERGLAGAPRALDGDDGGRSPRRWRAHVHQFGGLGLPAGELRQVARQVVRRAAHGRAAASGRRPRVAGDDALLEVTQSAARLRALLVDESPALLPVHVQGACAAPGPVQGAHQRADELLVERVVVDELGQLAHEVGVVPEPQLQRDPLHRGAEPLLPEAHPGPFGPGAAQIAQWSVRPQHGGLPHQRGGLLDLFAVREGLRLVAQPPEPMDVDEVGVGLEGVAVVAQVDSECVRGGFQACPQPGDVGVDRRPGRRVRLPETGDQRVDRYGPGHVQREERQDGALPWRANGLPAPVGPQFHGAKEAEFHTRLLDEAPSDVDFPHMSPM